jgi:hypothetical protein
MLPCLLVLFANWSMQDTLLSGAASPGLGRGYVLVTDRRRVQSLHKRVKTISAARLMFSVMTG